MNFTNPSSSSTVSNHRRRGSVLLVALMFAGIIALSIGSFLNLSNQASQYSYRTFYVGAAMNAAETGLEQALWAINKRTAGNTGVWEENKWTVLDTGAVRQTFALPNLSANTTAVVKVYVSSANLAGTPYAVARSIITPKRGAPIERWIRISLTKRSRFSTGLVAKDSLTFSGNNGYVDSYDSRKGAYNQHLGGTSYNKFDHGSAGSASIQTDSVVLSGADIFGTVVVGYSDSKVIEEMAKSGVTIGPFGTPVGTIVADNVLTDFTANFDDEPHPTATTYNLALSGDTTLPRAAIPEKKVKILGVWVTIPAIGKDIPADDGKYYYLVNSDITDSLTIASDANVVLVMNTGYDINIKGTDSVTLEPASSSSKKTTLAIYTQRDVAIAGNGVVNSGAPADFALYGTCPQTESNQNIKIAGNGVLSAVVYAPNADITLNGGGTNGNVYGSVIGETITVTGGSQFHYDEALAELDTSSPFTFSEWIEYVSAKDRSAYASMLNF